MTRGQVDQIVKTTIWEDDPIFGSDIPKAPYERYLKLEGAQAIVDSETGRLVYPDGSIDSLHEASLTIACDSADNVSGCARTTFMRLLFYDNRLCAIFVTGESFTEADAALAKSWIETVDHHFTRMYGNANHRDPKFAELRVKDLVGMEPGESVYAEWQLPKSRYSSSQSVAILVMRSDGKRSRRPLTSSIIIQDTDNATLLFAKIYKKQE
jgi:hypothetical protein